ncbi:hypothetical protein UlMin_008442 [Ulmus minor]
MYIRTNSLKSLFSIKRKKIEIPQRPIWKCFSYEEISGATNCFSSENLVGKGGFKEVYRGILTNGEEIAVKRLAKPVSDERKEDLIEIRTIGRVWHLNGCQRRIIHRDIKSSNVLLTTDFEPLISDFGLAKWPPSQWTHHSIAPIKGTFGSKAWRVLLCYPNSLCTRVAPKWRPTITGGIRSNGLVGKIRPKQWYGLLVSLIIIIVMVKLMLIVML